MIKKTMGHSKNNIVRKALIFISLIALPFGLTAQTSATLDVKPGTLQDMLLDLDYTPSQLILTGTLNSVDLSYINKGTGKMSDITDLDITAISLEYDGGMYASISGRDDSGIGLGTITRQFYLSSENYNDTTSSPNGLGGGNVIIKYYCNNLAGAFINNQNFSKVKLPNVIENYGGFIFSGSNIENLDFPTATSEIAEFSFADTNKITSLNIPNIIQIGEKAFYNSTLTSINCPQLKVIGNGAFQGSQIQSIDLSNVTSLGSEAFSDTENLISIDLSNLDYIPFGCFSKSGLRDVEFGTGLTEIGGSAFMDCKQLTSIRLPQGLKIIERAAFLRSNITEFNVPSSVISIGANALPSEWLNKQPTEDGVYYFGTIAYEWKETHEGATDIVIKEGTTSISDGFGSSYYLQTSLKKLTLPSSLKIIGGIQHDDDILNKLGVFYGCSELEEVILPEGIEIIGTMAFSGCKNMRMSFLPSSIKAIGSNAFYGCSSITPVILISENFEFLGTGAFGDCEKISEVIYKANLAEATEPFPKTIEKITFGSNVTFIPNNLLGGCTSLVKVIFEDSDTETPNLEIGDYAFGYCTSLKFEQLPQRVLKIGKETFEGVNFGEKLCTNNITFIGDRAFYSVKGIKELEIGEKLQICGVNAFDGIETLETINFRSKNLELIPTDITPGGVIKYSSPFSMAEKIIIGNNVEYIPERLFANFEKTSDLTFESREQENTGLLIDSQAFYGMKGLTSVVLPDVKTAIGESAFEQCRNLTSYHIGYGTESIYPKAFYNPSEDLTEIDIPETVSWIGESAFNSSGLDVTLYFHSIEPPEMKSPVCLQYATAYVPSSSLQAYKETGLNNCNILPYAEAWVSISQSEISLTVGETVQLAATIEPEEFADLEIIWLSLNPEIANVNEEGMITALSEGEATIQVYPMDFPENISECQVTVIANNIEPDPDPEPGPNPDDSGVESIEADANGNYTVFNLYGLKIFTTQNAYDIENLKEGIYIINGKKILIQNQK